MKKSCIGLLVLVAGCEMGAGADLYDPEVADLVQAAGTDNNDFGRTFAAGDFDADGFLDLAVGSPLATVGNATGSGAVYLYRGSSSGLVFSRVISQETAEQYPDGTPKPGTSLGTDRFLDQFGSSLVAADLDHDGVTDLAVGARGDVPWDGQPACGAVYFFAGRKKVSGSQSFGPQPWFLNTQNSILFSTIANESGDRFGVAMAAGDFDGDGKKEIAIAADGKNDYRGRVYIVSAEGPGFWPLADQTIDLDASPADGDAFGRALAVGTLDNVAGDELAIGAPFQNVGADTSAGRVFVYRKGSGGLVRWGSGLVGNVSGSGAQFGSTIDIGNLDGTAPQDVVVGRQGGGHVLVFRGNNTAVPSQWKTVNQAAIGPVAVGNIVGSSIEDLVVAGWIYRGDAAGPVFTNMNAALWVVELGGIVFGNFDGKDGNDLVVGDPGMNKLFRIVRPNNTDNLDIGQQIDKP
jgi:hypothetical protein